MMQGRNYQVERFQFILSSLTTLHACDGDDHFKRYEVAENIANNNQFAVTSNVLHDRLISAWSDMTVHNLTFRQAVIYFHFKEALKQHFLHGRQDSMTGKKLIEFSNEFSKTSFLQIGVNAGLSENEVTEILPALALKFAHSEVKFIEKGYHGGLFKSVQEYANAFKEIDGKYEKYFTL